MPELRLHLSGGDLAAITPELSWKGECQRGAALSLVLDPKWLEDLRWLWEDPLVDLFDAGSGRRKRAEQAVSMVGMALGTAFTATEQMRRLLATALAPRQETVVLISSESDPALALPWEITRFPDGMELSSMAGGIARQRENAGTAVSPGRAGTGLLKVLLVVSRPAGSADVEYQAIAARLLTRLEGRAQVTLVRPGTFAAFDRLIREQEWDLVHYDGHGVAGELVFEDQLVKAEKIGAALARSGVPVFALNACQSAVSGGSYSKDAREVGSVARALVDTGALAVVAMGASVRVSSAVTFFDTFYEQLSRGGTLSSACQDARRAIGAAGDGKGHGPLDWAIPVLYLRHDFAPFQDRGPSVDDILNGAGQAPADPAVFIGRDADLYVLDRAVDEHPRLLLFGAAGVGKTTLAEHLLDWQRRTNGVSHAARFSFRGAPPMEEFAGFVEREAELAWPEAGQRFRSAQWAAMPLGERLRTMAKVLGASQGGMRLFFLDNVETLAGYPDAGSGPYTAQDRESFRGFLHALDGRRTRVVLTSRRDEVALLRDRVRRVRLRGVKGRHRMEMLREYTGIYGSDTRLREVLDDDAQRPALDELLRRLGGHPSATRVAAYGLSERTADQVISSFRGQAERIEIPAGEDGDGSLEEEFAGALERLADERRRGLALLGVFTLQFYEADLFDLVADAGFPDGVVADRSHDALRRVLRDACALGLIARAEGNDRVWELVPGAQAVLDQLGRGMLDAETFRRLELRFLQHVVRTAARETEEMHSGGKAGDAIRFCEVEEGNLRHALHLAERERDLASAHVILELLLEFWRIQGRLGDLDGVVDAWTRATSGPAGGPPAYEDESATRLWCYLRSVRAERLIEAGRYDAGMEIHQSVVDHLQAHPGTHLDLLATSIAGLGAAYRRRGDPKAAERCYSEALEIRGRLRDDRGMASIYHRLGRVKMEGGEPDEAERLYRESLGIRVKLDDRAGMAAGYYRLGMIELERDNLAEAENWLRQALEIDTALGHRAGKANTYYQLGRLERKRGRDDEAETFFRSSLKIDQGLGDHLGMATTYLQLCSLEKDRDRAQAEQWGRRSLAIHLAGGDKAGIARAYAHLTELSAAWHDHEGAASLARDALRAFKARGPMDQAVVVRELNRIRSAIGPDAFASAWREVVIDPYVQTTTAYLGGTEPDAPVPGPGKLADAGPREIIDGHTPQ
jgi:tetratricopeptide (TPR) repeat protein